MGVVYLNQRLGAAHSKRWLVEIVIFSVFAAKNLRKQEICSKYLQKNSFFLVCTRTLVDCFISKKVAFSLKNPLLPIISCELLVLLSHFGQWGLKPLFFECNTLITKWL